MTALILPTDFIGLENVVHLAAGGETPILKSHRQAVENFFTHKAMGEGARHHFEAIYRSSKERIARLLHVSDEDVAFLGSSSDGVNLLLYALDWQPGDNVVVVDVEFPSNIMPWTRLEKQGVSLRVVSHQNWEIQLEDIAAAMDERTRLVAVSHVSYFTGQRLPLAELSEMVHERGALLLADVTHAAGVVPVEASLADVVVCSCYKWLLGVHGVGIFFRNPASLPDLQPPFLGWHSAVTIAPTSAPTDFTLNSNASRFEPGNPSFLGIYILENALGRLLEIGEDAIAAHDLKLSGQVWQGLKERGYDLMTPGEADYRAGNVCFMSDNVEAVLEALDRQNIRVWGSYAGVNRVRVSTHLYNTEADVERLLAAVPAAETIQSSR